MFLLLNLIIIYAQANKEYNYKTKSDIGNSEIVDIGMIEGEPLLLMCHCRIAVNTVSRLSMILR